MSFLDTYEKAFSLDWYNSHPDDEWRYRFALNQVRENVIGVVLDVGSGRGGFASQCPVPVTTVDLSKWHDTDCPHIDADLTDPKQCEQLLGVDAEAVVCLDTLEHLPESDIDRVLGIFSMIAPHLVVVVSNHSDTPVGEELHLTQRSRFWWRACISKVFDITESHTVNDGKTYGFSAIRKPIPRASICMSTFNKDAALELSLMSIFQQRPPFGFEVIVVDDGSSDDTAKVLDNYPWVRRAYLDRPGYENPAPARNLAYRMARGEVVICQCEVIHHLKDTIERLVLALDPGRFIIAKVNNAKLVNEGGRRTTELFEIARIVEGQEYTGAYNQRPLFFLGSLFREDLYAVGGNDDTYGRPGWDDWDFARCLIDGRKLKPNYLHEIVGWHVEHDRPQDVCDSHAQMEAHYKRRMASGERVATGGPWRM